ncbi:MAG: helix-turn-helix domain-containing protein [Lentisphaeria bacterium]|nr:MAG: helix-turn-helix domain-containing protein [Lentisphaeria bacterium]
MRAKTLIQSVDRAIEILEIVRDADGPVRAAMIAHEMELPLKTAHNLIRSLLQHGYLVQNEEKSYQLGPECFLLADQAKGPFSQLGRQVGTRCWSCIGRVEWPPFSAVTTRIGSTV